MAKSWKSISAMTVVALLVAMGAALIPASPVQAADQLYENHSGDTGIEWVSEADWYAQTFTAQSNHDVTSVKLWLCRYDSPGTVTVSIRATDGSGKPTGPDLASGTTSGNTLPAYGSGKEWRQIPLSPTLSLSQNTKYAIVVRAPSSGSIASIGWYASYSGDLYSGGAMYESINSGGSWSEEWGWDGSFEVWGPYTPPPNQAPVLTAGYVAPSSGSTSTDFYYYVHYFDADGDSPSVKDVYVDYVPHAMSLYSEFAANGTYRYGPVNLDCSSGITFHRYSFSFNDGQGHTTCLPASCSAFTLGPTVPITFGEAVDNTGLSWTAGGDASWWGQCDKYYWDHDAAESGNINDSQSTWLETTVNGPGTVSFYWKVSSEETYDRLEFLVDGSPPAVYSISGLVDWEPRSYSLGGGTHTLRWEYSKDGTISDPYDCGWLDKLDYIYTATDKIGVWQNAKFYLDYDGSGLWNPGDKVYTFGNASCTPLIGNWEGL